MTHLNWREEAITKEHHRENFNCGEDQLNIFLRQHARKSHDQGGAKTFLAIDCKDSKTILGFYSLSPTSLDYARTPQIIQRGLARYDVPAFRLARLAVSLDTQKQGLGGQLLLAAGRRCLRVSAEVGGVMLLIDAKNKEVARWYESYGAIALFDTPLCLVLPLSTIKAALEQSIVTPYADTKGRIEGVENINFRES